MKHIPSPQQLGLPEKFETWRPNQEAAINSILDDSKRVNVLIAPTGFGKQAVALGAAVISDEATCIVTANRGLQNQYLEDGKELGLVDLRGRQNYKCDMREDYSCEEGYAARCPYKGTVGCPSSKAEIAASTSKLVVTNYDKWTSSKKFGQGMSHFTRVIFDEGHSAPDALARAMQVILHFREIEKDLEILFLGPPQSEDFLNWKAWAFAAKRKAQMVMEETLLKITSSSDPKPSWVKHYTHMKNLVRRLAVIATANAKDWIVEETEEGFKFDPIRPAKYAESALLFRIPHISVITATGRPKTLYMMGVSKENFNFHEFPSDFNPKDCPIYYIPTMRVDYKTKDLSMLWTRLDQIMSRRRDRKGIVHTVSYARRDEIMATSRYADSMIINVKGEPPTEMIDLFRLSGPGTTLVTPSVGTGYDFPGKDCQWQFVCKIPYPPPSKIVEAREADDKEYRPYIAMQTMVQMFGRGARYKGDICENFICDDHLKWFLPRYSHLAPKWFHGFFQERSVLPRPLEVL